MGVEKDRAQQVLDDAVKLIFASNAKAHAVGIGRHNGEFGIRVVTNVNRLVAMGASTETPPEVDGVPIVYAECYQDVSPAVMLPASGPGSPFDGSFVPEQAHHRPLYCGLQVQNFDDDDRQGVLARGFITIGTLGCFVELDGGDVAMLSNNHVLAGENDGIVNVDRILQPGTANPNDVVNQQVAILTDFEPILPSPPGASPAQGNVDYNVLDAAVATLVPGINFHRAYLPSRNVPAAISGPGTANVDDIVFKVGRTTGYTEGKVTMSSTVVGPVPYRPGGGWFQSSLEIEGLNGTLFSNQGDSGSAIVNASTGEVVGILYAGNGTQTYACPIDVALTRFNCDLI